MRRSRRAAGFTLIELLVVLALFGVATIVLIPALSNMFFKAKTMGASTQLTTLMRLARAQAVSRNTTVIVKALAVATAEGDAHEIFAFTDVDGDGVWDPPSGGFALSNDGPKLSGSFRLPTGLMLAGPGAADDGNATAFESIATESGGKVGVVRFLSSGGVAVVGAIRLRDLHDNILEVRVAPQATGRVALRKFEGDPTGADDLAQYYVQGGVATIGGDTDHTWNWR